MKKTIYSLLLAVALIASETQAQPVKNKNNEKYQQLVQREIMKRQQSQLHNNAMLPDSVIIFDYLRDRKLVTVSFLEYNEKGEPTVIEYYFNLWDERGERLELRYDYFPYYHGITGFSRNVETTYYYWRKGTYVAYGKNIWEYDQYGKLTGIKLIEFDDDEILYLPVITEADAQNRIISEEMISDYSHTLDTYEYGANGKIETHIESEDYDFEVNRYYYDSKDFIDEIIREEHGFSQGIYSRTKDVNFYDSYNRLVRTDSYYDYDCIEEYELEQYAIYYYSGDVNIKSQINSGDIKIVTGNANIFLESEATIFSVGIYNIVGQSIFQKTLSENSISISKSTFVAGIYMIKLITEKGIIVEKVVIQ